MRGTQVRIGVALSCIWLAACTEDSFMPDCEGASPACGADELSKSILTAGARAFQENNEGGNGSTPEATGYVLESSQGMAIAGRFEAEDPTPDGFIFDSATFGRTQQPGFPGADIQLVVDGQALDTGEGASLSLDTIEEYGYSSLTGAYFRNAALMSGKQYVVRITPSAALAGKAYTLEIRGHVAEQ